MSDDEDFIGAIVDAPGDDAPRLVYADWLDERDDPRGAYLRALVVWARQGSLDTQKLESESLDPVWVARISRPPLGICCVSTRFEDADASVTEADVRSFEKRFNAKFPADYRAFLLNFNAGRPVPRRSFTVGILSVDVDWIYPLLHEDRHTLETGLIARALEHFDQLKGGLEPSLELLTIAQLQDQFGDNSEAILRLSPDDFGRVLHRTRYEQSDEDLVEVAESFTTFLTRIELSVFR
jgi:uncharacterized protein (TIGR02996 family)